MGLGQMNGFTDIVKTKQVRDSEGFTHSEDEVLASIRVYREGRHGSERWANLAAFSEATDLFRFRRIPGLTVTTDHKVLEQIVSDMDANEELRIQARNNSQEHFRFPFNDAFMDVVIGRMAQNQQFCERVLDDAKFGDTVRDLLIGVVYDRLRKSTGTP